MGVRRILLVVSAVATFVLLLEKVGAYQIVPGGDLHLQSQPLADAARPGLSLRNDAGNLTCWIRLVVRADRGQPTFGVPSWSGDPLTIVPRALGTNLHEVKISKQPNPPDGVPFLWRAGLPLDLETLGSPGVPITLEDWVVFPNNQPSDTRAKAQGRWWWTRISWGLGGPVDCRDRAAAGDAILDDCGSTLQAPAAAAQPARLEGRTPYRLVS